MHAFTIISYEVKDFLEDLGEDMIYFVLKVEKDGDEFRATIFYNDLCKYCRNNAPEIAKYFDDIRRSINGFGPKETKVWAALQAESFDIEPLLNEYLRLNPGYMTPAIIQMTPEQHASVTAKVEGLQDIVGGMKYSNIRNIAFKDTLMEELSAKVLEYFPEIFESEPEYIKEVKGILSNHILNLSSDLDKLSYKARNPLE